MRFKTIAAFNIRPTQLIKKPIYVTGFGERFALVFQPRRESGIMAHIFKIFYLNYIFGNRTIDYVRAQTQQRQLGFSTWGSQWLGSFQRRVQRQIILKKSDFGKIFDWQIPSIGGEMEQKLQIRHYFRINFSSKHNG